MARGQRRFWWRNKRPWGWGNQEQPPAALERLPQVLLGAFGGAGGPGDGAMPPQSLRCLHRTFCKATVSLSAGG